MATQKASVRLSGRFSPGTTVELHPRSLGALGYRSGSTDAVAKAKTDKSGDTVFENVEPGTYWAVGDVDGTERAVQVTAKEQPSEKQRLSGDEIRAKLASTAATGLGDDRSRRAVTGARGSKNAGAVTERARGRHGTPFALERTGAPTPAAERTIEPHPAARLEDATGLQRSDTVTGEATPVDANEVQPGVKQEDVPDTVLQRSSTPLGEATPIPEGEVQPQARQEDVKDTVLQRSSTATGSATPIPAQDVKGTPAKAGKRGLKPAAKKAARRKAAKPKSSRSSGKGGQKSRDRVAQSTGKGKAAGARKTSARKRS